MCANDTSYHCIELWLSNDNRIQRKTKSGHMSGCMKIMTKLLWGHGKITKTKSSRWFRRFNVVLGVNRKFEVQDTSSYVHLGHNQTWTSVSTPEVFWPANEFNVLDHLSPFLFASTWLAPHHTIRQSPILAANLRHWRLLVGTWWRQAFFQASGNNGRLFSSSSLDLDHTKHRNPRQLWLGFYHRSLLLFGSFISRSKVARRKDLILESRRWHISGNFECH